MIEQMNEEEWEKWSKNLHEKLQSPEGKRELEMIKRCSKAARKRFEDAEKVSAELIHRKIR